MRTKTSTACGFFRGDVPIRIQYLSSQRCHSLHKVSSVEEGCDLKLMMTSAHVFFALFGGGVLRSSYTRASFESFSLTAAAPARTIGTECVSDSRKAADAASRVERSTLLVGATSNSSLRRMMALIWSTSGASWISFDVWWLILQMACPERGSILMSRVRKISWARCSC